jgi:HEAT repeat protein
MRILTRISHGFLHRASGALAGRWLALPLAALGTLDAADQANSPAAVADQVTVDQQTVQQLVEQLAEASFAVRQRTARRLEELGPIVKPALVAALQHPDAEVRHRARRILTRVLEVDFDNRVAAFAADKTGTVEDLPGWKLFKSIAGDHQPARQLYIQAIRAEPLLMEALEQGGTYASRTVTMRAKNLFEQRLRNRTYRRTLPGNTRFAASVTALLIAISDTELDLDDRTATSIFQMMQHSGLVQQLNGNSQQEPLRDLVGVLIKRTADTSLAYQSLWISMQYNLAEGLIPAAAIIRRGERQPYVLQDAMLAIGKLGSKEHIELLTPLLANDTSLGNQFNRKVKKSFQPQVRDVALAVIIHLSGEKPQDYGFTAIQEDAVRLFRSNTMGFASDEQRQAAHKKWQQWLAGQPHKRPTQDTASR